jgi:Glycosyl transferase family 2
MKEIAAVVTMVKDDHDFLRRWVKYYGDIFGREALYVFAHGGEPEISEIAAGCNVMRLPPGYDPKWAGRRARLFGNMARALQNYFDFVLVTDVDEFIVVDPETGFDLRTFLTRRRTGSVISPIGVEVVHRPQEEPEPIDTHILGPRRFVRFSSFYCKPIILGTPQVSFARGQHYSTHPELRVFQRLYLFHMKFCDRHDSQALLESRAQTISTAGYGEESETELSTRWNKLDGKEEAFLDRLANLPKIDGWDFGPEMTHMQDTWGPRDNELYHFEKLIGKEVREVPARFFGIV